MKLDPGNTELLSQRQRLLTQAVDETAEKLRTLKLAAEQANTALANNDISQEQYDALQREIIETENNLKSLQSQANESASALDNISAAGEKLQKAGDNISSVGKKLLPVTAALTAAGGVSAKMAMDFEDAMAKVSTIADTTQIPLEDLEKAIMELSNQTGISSDEIAQNVYDAISAGQETEDAVNFVSNSSKLAKAGFADAGDALDILTTIMNSYGMEATEVANVSDMLIQTQNLGKTTVGELSGAMGKIIPTANAYGVELDQLCAGYAIMTSNGVATAESTTYMNSMLNELGKSGTTVSDIIKKKTGSSFSELMDNGYSLSEVLEIVQKSADEQNLSFGDMWSSSEAAKAGLILLGDGAENFNTTLDAMNKSTGATDTAFQKLQTNSYTIQKAINQLKNTAIELGTAIMNVLAPVITSVSNKISELANWFSGLSESTKQTIVTVGMVVAAAGPVLIVIGKIVSSIGTIMTIIPKVTSVINTVKGAFSALNATMLANPITLIIVAIAALVAAFIYLWNTNSEFKEAITEIWNEIVTKIQEFCAGIVERLNALGFDFESILDVLKALWDGFCSVLAPVFEGAFKVVTNVLSVVMDVIIGLLDVFIGLFNGDWNQLWTGVKEIFSGIWNFISNSFKTVTETLLGILESFLGLFGISLNDIWDGIKSVITNIINTIKNGFNTAVEFVKGLASSAFDWGKDIIDGIVNGIKSCIDNVGDAVKSVAEKIWAFLHFSVPDEGPLTDYETWMPDFMSGLAKGIEQSKDMIQKAVSGVASDMIISPKVSGIRGPSQTKGSLEANKAYSFVQNNYSPESLTREQINRSTRQQLQLASLL